MIRAGIWRLAGTTPPPLDGGAVGRRQQRWTPQGAGYGYRVVRSRTVLDRLPTQACTPGSVQRPCFAHLRANDSVIRLLAACRNDPKALSHRRAIKCENGHSSVGGRKPQCCGGIMTASALHPPPHQCQETNGSSLRVELARNALTARPRSQHPSPQSASRRGD
jgi:hypothetical protein